MMGPDPIMGAAQAMGPDALTKAGQSAPRPSHGSGADQARSFMDELRAEAAGPVETRPQPVEVQATPEMRPPVSTSEVAAIDPPQACTEVEMSIQRMLEPGPLREGINGRMHDVRDQWGRLEKARVELGEAVREGRLDQMSPEYGRIRESLAMATLRLQVRAQEAHFGVELISKLVENATGGIRTILQTQA